MLCPLHYTSFFDLVQLRLLQEIARTMTEGGFAKVRAAAESEGRAMFRSMFASYPALTTQYGSDLPLVSVFLGTPGRHTMVTNGPMVIWLESEKFLGNWRNSKATNSTDSAELR